MINQKLTMSDRIAIMNKGNISQIGTPDDIYENLKILCCRLYWNFKFY